MVNEGGEAGRSQSLWGSRPLMAWISLICARKLGGHSALVNRTQS